MKQSILKLVHSYLFWICVFSMIMTSHISYIVGKNSVSISRSQTVLKNCGNIQYSTNGDITALIDSNEKILFPCDQVQKIYDEKIKPDTLASCIIFLYRDSINYYMYKE